jgi:hypothetical protein
MKLCEPNGYPESWEKDFGWDGKLSVHFGYPSCGWVLMSVLSTGCLQHLTIHLSDAFDPFWEMVDWLKAIADDNLPACLKIDEEGQCKELIVRRYQGRRSKYADIEFRINGDYWDEKSRESKQGCFFLSLAMRSQLLHEFTRRLERWLSEDFDPNSWNAGWSEDGPYNPDDPINALWDLRNLDIAGLKEKIRANGALGSPDSAS